MRRYAAAAAAVLLTVALGACGDDEPSSTAETPSADTGPSGSATPDPTGAESPATGTLPAPGTADAPAPVAPARDLLDWQEHGQGPQLVTSGTTYSLTTSKDNRVVEVDGADGRKRLVAPRGFHWNDTLLDGPWAVAVAQHDAEQKPSVATVVDLTTGRQRTLDGTSDPATVNGGAWAIGQGRLFHATYGPKNAYCLAEVDLTTLAGQTTYCAEPRTGFTNVRVSPAGLSLMSFDAGQVSCRTILSIGEAAMEPFAGAPACHGWEGIAMPDDGSVFTVVPKENRIESARVTARVGAGYYDLGPATTGSLVWCDGAAYFSRDPQQTGDASQLLRWDGDQLAVVFEGGGGGESALSAPRCGGDAVTVSLLAESGDRQVTAPTG